MVVRFQRFSNTNKGLVLLTSQSAFWLKESASGEAALFRLAVVSGNMWNLLSKSAHLQYQLRTIKLASG